MTGEHLLQICKKGKVRYQGRGEAVFGSVTFLDEALEESAAHLKMAESRIEADWVDGEKAMTYLEYGSIQHLPYPFTPEKYVNRQTDLIESTKSLFSDASSSCTLGFSPVALSSKTPELRRELIQVSGRVCDLEYTFCGTLGRRRHRICRVYCQHCCSINAQVTTEFVSDMRQLLR